MMRVPRVRATGVDLRQLGLLLLGGSPVGVGELLTPKRRDRLPPPCVSFASASEDFRTTLQGFPEWSLMRHRHNYSLGNGLGMQRPHHHSRARPAGKLRSSAFARSIP